MSLVEFIIKHILFNILLFLLFFLLFLLIFLLLYVFIVPNNQLLDMQIVIEKYRYCFIYLFVSLTVMVSELIEVYPSTIIFFFSPAYAL